MLAILGLLLLNEDNFGAFIFAARAKQFLEEGDAIFEAGGLGGDVKDLEKGRARVSNGGK
jgi:hypothetical protein